MTHKVAFVWSILFLLVGGALAYLVYTNHVQQTRPFTFGLDLVGGSHLVYEADTDALQPQEVGEAMNALRDVIERRVNVFGVSEPLVQVERASGLSGSEHRERLIVELPGVTDLDEAVRMIGATPTLSFALVTGVSTTTGEQQYTDTGLTGRYVSRAQVEFVTAQQGGSGFGAEPIVALTFTAEGRELFATITREHVGEQLAIFLDGDLKNDPVIREPILGGTAQISGGFTIEEAKELVRNLNIGALPVPITLLSTQTVGATLGEEVLEKGVVAVLIGLCAVFVFMIVWYRTLGIVASVALTLYVVSMLTLFQYIPVTITAAGIAGFLLSIGMAVDANVLIFERLKEAVSGNEGVVDTKTAKEAFARAWPPIRDGNLTSIISAVVLFWVGTGMVQGFALVFGIGVLLSMATALLVSRVLLLALLPLLARFPMLARSGFGNAKHSHT
jgi:preprotein translocase subunit SecD